MTNPRISRITSTVTVAWSDGTPFTGYYLFVLTDPSDGVTPWVEFDLNTNMQGVPLPGKVLWPIVQGVPNQSLGLWYNADITPPTSQYTPYLYDSGRRSVVGASTAFSVNAATFTPTTMTPTIPSTFTSPTPD